MSSAYIAVLVFLCVSLVVLVIVWRLAGRIKKGLDEQPDAAIGDRCFIELSAKGIEELRALTSDPILLKQGEEGVRVQIEHRPMLPLMAFVGRDVSSALSETAARITERYGAKWAALVSVAADGRITVQRLA